MAYAAHTGSELLFAQTHSPSLHPVEGMRSVAELCFRAHS